MQKASEKIDLNTAGVEELVSIGLPSSKARRILEYRQWRGCFRSVDEVLKVRGIGQMMFEKLEPYVCVVLPEPSQNFAGMSQAEKVLLGLECCEKHRCAACPYFEWFTDRQYDDTKRECIARNRADVKNLLREMCGRE